MSRNVRSVVTVAVLVLLAWTGRAAAHITMLEPAPRTSAQKESPCGAAGSARGTRIAVFEPGQTITVSWNETVDHRGHYRIAFDTDGEDDFVDPTEREDLYNSPAVLVDDIADSIGGRYTQEITFPDVECERCTLQLIQVMYGSGNYYQCADIALRRGEAPALDAGTPAIEDAGAATGDDAGPLPERDAGPTVSVDGGPPAAGSDPAPGAPAVTDSGTVTGGCAITPRAPRVRSAWLAFALVLLVACRHARRRCR